MNMSSRDVTQGIDSQKRLTNQWLCDILLSLTNEEEYDSATSKRLHHWSGMDPTREAQKGERETLSLCSSTCREQSKGRVALHCPYVKSGKSDRRHHTSKTGESKINLRPALGRPQISQNFYQFFVATRFLTNAWKTEVKNPRDVLPFSSITRLAKSVKLYKSWVCTRKCAYSWL